MSAFVVGGSATRSRGIAALQGQLVTVAHGAGSVARSLEGRVRKIDADKMSRYSANAEEIFAQNSGTTRRSVKSVEENLYDALAAFKVRTSNVAMYLGVDWRDKLFRQLDSLLDAEEWDVKDLPPTLASFATFLRMVLKLNPSRRPGLACSSNGNIIATWTIDKDRLTIECLPNDQVRWMLSRALDREIERAAGLTLAVRLAEVLAPYNPSRWFDRAVSIPAR